VPTPFDEEKVDSYEVGAKLDFGDFRFNAAAFRAEYGNIQLIFRQGVVPLLFNAGKARIQGLEAELSYHPRSGLQIDLAASTLDDKILSITPVPGATATVTPADDLPFTPAFQGNFGLAYALPVGSDLTLTPRLDGNYTTKITFITGSVPDIEQGDYFIGNASISLGNKAKGWKVTAGVLNLFDERYLVQGNASLGTLGYAEKIYARPRNWYLQASISF
jgi:iron complex outermembrane receptor protein